ncbi:precorrin-6A synthase (deacetylating) [Marichromatium gracile]|uniref:precorrin-6A synthase (deacetylating) n=1 Tax=Marichromatium gracile TaxID=1048 RepID=UPI001F408DBE|nr:precorrin-6A synthase (deacetylating) [Marichromatium gracile]MCF1184807.1 precorrin-6A synthase (deacetylating) [Marichromatium gracile]
MKTLYLIGMGPGDPKYLTLQAIETMRKTDVFFMLDKAGRGKEDLLALRHQILEAHCEPGSYRVVIAESPQRTIENGDYKEGVRRWHQRKREIFAELIERELADGQSGAFLLWGDPALYDQTITNITELVAEQPEQLRFEVIPGITSVQVLTARHKIPLNRVGEAITITTGRHAEHCDPATLDNAVVMLDYNASYQRFTGQDMDLYWGGLVGTADERLVAGALDEVVDEALRARAELKAEKGWQMDIYLLRRRRDEQQDED